MIPGLKKIAAFDLNLLVAFAAIDEHRHITRAADAIGLSQSALSHALNRLRTLLGDPLFVKSSRGMVPTPRAEKLSAPVREMVAALEEKVLGTSSFQAAAMDRTFRVESTDFIESLLVPKLLGLFESEAPRARVAFKTARFALPKEELELGKCDLAIAGFFGELPEGFYQQKLFSDGFLCAVRKGHPRLVGKAKVSLDDYCRERHVLIAPGGQLSARVDEMLRRQKRGRFIVAGLSSFMVSGWIAAQGDAIVSGPSRVMHQIAATFDLHLFKSPLEIPRITIVQAWHERNHQDPGHRWFREHVRGILGET